jgi:hypothetical protein
MAFHQQYQAPKPFATMMAAINDVLILVPSSQAMTTVKASH